jgi:hypothetical protein
MKPGVMVLIYRVDPSVEDISRHLAYINASFI